MKIYWIDLFCGAGGTTTGIHLSKANASVIACVNHDQMAIDSHKENHPDCLHLTEDVRDKKVVATLGRLVSKLRVQDPDCHINLWASLECTNYSKAKGGLPRDADSRTLAESLFMYVEELQPDYIFIENVREFMAWGPLDENGRPVSRKNGKDYVKWCNRIQGFGYNYDFRLLNAADYGAYTSRLRYFGQFAKKDLPIGWPLPTHAKELPESEGMFPNKLKKWRPVKEVLDLDDEGSSIFERKKPLSENTLKRIYAGLVKFVANGDEEFTKVYNSGNDFQRVKSMDEPIGSVTTQNSHAKVKAIFLSTYYGNGGLHGVEGPSPTVTTKDRVAKVEANFLLDYQYKSNAHSLERPCPTIVTKDKLAQVTPHFLVNSYSGGGQHTDIHGPAPSILTNPKSNLATCNFMDQQFGKSTPSDINGPSGALTTNPKMNLVSAKPWIMDTNFANIGSDVDGPNRTITASRHHHYLVNPQFQSKGASVEEPCPTIIARQDKKPLSMINCRESSGFGVIVFHGDSEMTVKIKYFMAYHGLVDIKMRMLKIPELLKIQGFPKGYKLKGTKTDQKKFIGNAVVPLIAQSLVESNYSTIKKHLEKAA
ncbi:DNA cytosine methyltransferase [Flagellimonas marina]|uniref:DNA (cytosine-5-)-methyltransferase n=1 Tax=Flagellimonas marina TaxID=1775168 RepID=A0ABV8PIL4_9FLAO